ncbi:nucleoside diphosphate-linked moiety X motif 13 isoform X2 [Pseudoliparis swirei]|uniref:nucleoside diphosphate-linked moiety X motif 13 isoform X2 n=1 Tax=Pseudoliparis swirei TaxID=2059687 RepID=UPI0024BEC9CA|nr:nucleoside diphosphate-linked moiety X motif 13 isoform X2 [Pseudoliparis swirei]
MLRRLKISRLSTRCCSNFVSRMRYVSRLKEDDSACAAALQNAHMFLFHRLDPLLQRCQQGTFSPVTLRTTDVQLILERLGSNRTLLQESVLIGSSEQNQLQFCLDLGELDQAAVEQECGGRFMNLRKAFFLLPEPAAPLVAKGQALLRWHQTSGFCSATGEPTRRNQAGSQRVCSSSGITYYPKMSPVVIILVSDGKRCLLGRQSSFPQGMYSALAGFCDLAGGSEGQEAARSECGVICIRHHCELLKGASQLKSAMTDLSVYLSVSLGALQVRPWRRL